MVSRIILGGITGHKRVRKRYTHRPNRSCQDVRAAPNDDGDGLPDDRARHGDAVGQGHPINRITSPPRRPAWSAEDAGWTEVTSPLPVTLTPIGSVRYVPKTSNAKPTNASAKTRPLEGASCLFVNGSKHRFRPTIRRKGDRN